MPRSFLEIERGIYIPGKRFAFTNISSDPFTSYWNRIPITIQPDDTIELSDTTPIPGSSMGHCLAVKMTMELVDYIIMKEAKLDEQTKNQPYYRSPIGLYLNVAQQRKPYEDKILRELAIDEESPAIQYMREKLKQEILAGGQTEQAPPDPVAMGVPSADFRAAITSHQPLEGFAEISKNNQEIKEAPKAPAKVKKMGRPRKNEAIITPGQ